MLVTEPAIRCRSGARDSPARRSRAPPLREDSSSLPDLDAVPDEIWRRAALVRRTPNNPTGATALLALYERLAALAQAHISCSPRTRPTASSLRGAACLGAGVSDRAVGRPQQPLEALVDDRVPLRVRRGDPGSSRRSRRTAVRRDRTQEFVQRASVVAWGDEDHVERTRERYRQKGRCSSPRSSAGCAPPAAIDLSSSGWPRRRAPSEVFAAQLLEEGSSAHRVASSARGRGLRPGGARPDAGGLRAGRRAPCETIRREQHLRRARRASRSRDDYVEPAAWALGVAAAPRTARRDLVPAGTAGATAARARRIWEAAGAPPCRRWCASTRRRRVRARGVRAARRTALSPPRTRQPRAPGARSFRRGVAVGGARRRGSSRSSSPTSPPRRCPRGRLPAPHLLSHRAVQPHGLGLEGVFGILPNVVWTSDGPVPVRALRGSAHGCAPPWSRSARPLGGQAPADDDYVVPTGVRIADADRVRLGAHLAEGTTVMHEGFVNYNAGTSGTRWSRAGSAPASWSVRLRHRRRRLDQGTLSVAAGGRRDRPRA